MSILLIVVCLWFLWFCHRYAWWKPATSYKYPRILMYHMISPHRKGAKFNKLRVNPKDFEKQVRWLRRNGWTFATMSEVMNHQNALPDKTVAITFDDGFEDNYTHAFPVLKKYQAKATLYLVVDRHDRDWSTYKKAHHDSGELKNEPKLSDEQVREMLDSGVFELGGHTQTHANMAKLDEDTRKQELVMSKATLETTFETTINSFAYPFGIYTEQDPLHVAQAGYTHAVTTIEGIDPLPWKSPMELKRIKISGKDTPLAFQCRMKTGQRGWSK